jgi:hypothetical protein
MSSHPLCRELHSTSVNSTVVLRNGALFSGLCSRCNRKSCVPCHTAVPSSACGRASHDRCDKLQRLSSVRHRSWICSACQIVHDNCWLDYLWRPICLVLVSCSPRLRPTRHSQSSSYIYRNPIYHQVVFAIMLIACTIRGSFLLHWSDRSSQMPPKLKVELRRLMTTGSTMFLSGWVIWNLDNELCEGLTRYKIAIGWPLAFLLEGKVLSLLVL